MKTPSQTPTPDSPATDRGAIIASLAAVGSVLAASTCCLPVLPFIMAAGVAGSSAFLSALRPYLLGISILFIAFGFYQARRARACRRRPSRIGSALLWISTAFVVMSLFFPQIMANAAADLFGGGRTPSGQATLQDLNLSAIRTSFNNASGDVRVLLLLSPT